MRAPTSRARAGLRLSTFDVLWAPSAAGLALYLRDPTLFSAETQSAVITYCLVATAASLAFFWSFGIREALPSYFSVRDALQVAKAGICAALGTTAIVFALTRLEGIPRSAPLVHGLVLVAGLLAVRAIGSMFFVDRGVVTDSPASQTEHIIMVGSNHVTALFINLLQACSGCGSRVVAVLDENPNLNGRAISRVRIVGTPQDLESVVDEFHVHGVRIDRLVIGGGEDLLQDRSLHHLRRVCERRGLALETVPELAALRIRPRYTVAEHASPAGPQARIPGYSLPKRAIDLGLSATLLLFALPLMALVSLFVLIDIGSPVLFWQQRVGTRGRNFLVYKFRTLRAPFDRSGRPLSDEERLSTVGRLLRTTHLDELPQLLNVLVGDMSLIGPRPLLPVDQPEDPTVRLLVRPGITGWAQINGGKNISVSEKNALDEWYVRNMSLRVDVSIAAATLLIIIRGGSLEDWAGDAALRGKH